jgi:hypothetical protein
MSRSKEVGRLLRAQEKIQAKIKKDLPKVTSLLEEKINTWENEFSMGFFYQGQRYLETMDQQEKNYKLQKELQKLQKQQAKNEKLQKNTSGMSEKNQKKIFSSSTMNSTFNRSNNQLTPSTINNNNNNNNMTGSNNNKNPTKQNTNNLKSSNPLENLCSFSRDFSSAASIKSISTTSSSDDANNQLLH